jgi:mannose/fructose-specific phosphotransferase system component IIA
MIGAIIIGHGDLPKALIDALYTITGPQEGIIGISNRSCSMVNLKQNITDELKSFNKAVVFTDLPGGSCTIACRSLKIPVVSGVNLPMLLEFVLIRDKVDFDGLIEKLTATGREGIKVL